MTKSHQTRVKWIHFLRAAPSLKEYIPHTSKKGLSALRYNSFLCTSSELLFKFTAHNLNYPSLSRPQIPLSDTNLFNFTKASAPFITHTTANLKIQHQIYPHHKYHYRHRHLFTSSSWVQNAVWALTLWKCFSNFLSLLLWSFSYFPPITSTYWYTLPTQRSSFCNSYNKTLRKLSDIKHNTIAQAAMITPIDRASNRIVSKECA